jgi:hypothetical protein
MKMIISESKRDSAVIKWLDKKYGNLIPRKGIGYTDYFDEKGNNIFSFSYEEITIVSPDLQYDLFNMFGLKRYDLNQIVKPWIEETYGINVDLVQYTTWHCNNCGMYHPTKYHIIE